MRVALVITTYERPDALAAVLDSVARQHTAPAEIVIADDGSGQDTSTLIAGFAALSAVPVRAVTQPHDGFRLTRLRNLAIAATPMDYLVFIDGDMLLHPEFITDHVACARRGYFTQGVRVRADAALTGALLADPAAAARLWPGGSRSSGLGSSGLGSSGLFSSGLFSPGLGSLRRAYLLRAPALSSITRRLANGVIAIKGCNQGFWRDDLVRVNGFNEAIRGWGPEDKELCVRLGNAGVKRQTLLFGGIACHLHHAPAARDSLPANLSLLEDTRRERKSRCECGLDTHFRP